MTTTEPPATRLGTVASDLANAALFVARRLSAGATMWCWSPAWPNHARHVAVEYVHPVVVGKRAFPALAITESDPVVDVRVSARPGDLLVMVATGSDPLSAEVASAAAARGLGTVWIGTGDEPAAHVAQHVLWLGSGDPAFDGRFILLYHVLWELTQVCVEHPGALR